jgi:hypothetical protein
LQKFTAAAGFGPATTSLVHELPSSGSPFEGITFGQKNGGKLMSDEREFDDVVDRRGRQPNHASRPRSARSSQTSGRKRKSNAAVGGKHQRRNKHWSW